MFTFMIIRGIAQPGSATALGAVGRRFESVYPDHEFALVAQQDRAPAFNNRSPIWE
jgi:hypothetical protein